MMRPSPSPLGVLLDLVAPPLCIECGTSLRTTASPLCPRCDRGLPWWRIVDGCPRCGMGEGFLPEPDRKGTRARRPFDGCPGCLSEGSALHGCRSLLRYEGAARRWLPGFKTARLPFGPNVALRLAIDHLAAELGRRIGSETSERPDWIVPIPLHWRRRHQRGFNQTEPIARRIAGILDCSFAPGMLRRTRSSRSQARSVGRERRQNVQDSFRSTARFGSRSRVWLVDDVLTTGSTLDAAADALLDAGAFEVRGLTLAATLPARPRAVRRRSDYHARGPDGR
ncbi:MAG TPA: ComF family protein [Deltaproteobacteria bacterium]|nr:ComF family protein [Deltaproteobacteria bacterium]